MFLRNRKCRVEADIMNATKTPHQLTLDAVHLTTLHVTAHAFLELRLMECKRHSIDSDFTASVCSLTRRYLLLQHMLALVLEPYIATVARWQDHLTSTEGAVKAASRHSMRMLASDRNSGIQGECPVRRLAAPSCICTPESSRRSVQRCHCMPAAREVL